MHLAKTREIKLYSNAAKRNLKWSLQIKGLGTGMRMCNLTTWAGNIVSAAAVIECLVMPKVVDGKQKCVCT